MFRRVLAVIVLGTCIAVPGLAAAQERAPHTGSTAVGVDVGAFIPRDGQLDTALIVNALLEFYLTPRVSLRTDFGLTDPGFARESTDSLRQIPLRADVNYNWEGGKWHPFVGAGVGAYFIQFKDNGEAFGSSETRPGFNLGRRHRVLHRPHRVGEGRGALSHHRDDAVRSGPVRSRVHRRREEVLVVV
jgi:hypothetical protein